MKLIRVKCGDTDYFYNVFTRKNSGQEVKLDSLGQGELDHFMQANINKYSNLIIQRSDGNTIWYDSVNGDWVKTKTEKRGKL